MREFLKAFVLVFTIVMAALFTLRYADFPFLQGVKEMPALKDQIFPVMDEGMRVVRSLGRDGIKMLPVLQEQQWLVNLMQEPSPSAPAPGGTPSNSNEGGRAPASQGEESAPAKVEAPQSVGGALKELLGDKFQVMGQTLISSTSLSPVEVSLPQILSVYLKEDSQMILWSVRNDSGETYLVEVKRGAVELRRNQMTSANVALSLHSGTYKKLSAGERWIAAVVIRGRGVLEGARMGTRAEFSSLLQNLNIAPKVPGPANASAPAAAPAKTSAPSAAPVTSPAADQANGNPAAPAAAEDREPAGALDADLQ